MRNPELTRSIIIKEAAKLFNSQGYKATSISDITKKANLTKGAIYRHFQDKSSLEKEALRYMCNKMMNALKFNIVSAKDSKSKLYSILEYFEKYSENPPFSGGCPLMNAAIEADDSNQELKNVVHYIMIQMKDSICRVINNGIEHGQINKDTDAESLALLMISTLEGSVMMFKLFDEPNQLKNSIKFLKREIDQISI